MNTKLIKITNDHYIIVDDSEVKEGDWYIDDTNRIRQAVMGDGLYWAVRNGYKKITHSTNIDWNEVYYIPLSEVKELIGEVDVEEKAEELTKHLTFPNERKEGIIIGYNQALEDNKDKKYTLEDIKKAYYQGHKSGLGSENSLTFEHTIQSLQPKTEWEVEFDTNGKLKLK